MCPWCTVELLAPICEWTADRHANRQWLSSSGTFCEGSSLSSRPKPNSEWITLSIAHGDNYNWVLFLYIILESILYTGCKVWIMYLSWPSSRQTCVLHLHLVLHLVIRMWVAHCTLTSFFSLAVEYMSISWCRVLYSPLPFSPSLPLFPSTPPSPLYTPMLPPLHTPFSTCIHSRSSMSQRRLPTAIDKAKLKRLYTPYQFSRTRYLALWSKLFSISQISN